MEKDQDRKRIIEAALFLAGRGMKLKEICRAAGTTPANTKKLLLQIMEEFGQNSALEITLEDDLYKMKIRDKYLPKVKQMSSITDILDGDAKTLSIIAYYQPIRQSDIVKIRGNRAYDQIRRLIGRGLVSAEEKGKTKVLSVTTKFRDYFGNQIDEFRRQIESGELKAEVGELKAESGETESEKKEDEDVKRAEDAEGTEQPVFSGSGEASPDEAPAED